MLGRVRFVFKKELKKPEKPETEDKVEKKNYEEAIKRHKKTVKDIDPNPLQLILGEGFVELLGVTKAKSTKEITFSNKDPKSNNDSMPVLPILYEYIWSVGLTGDPPESSWCEKLDENDSIVVQLIFHVNKSRFSIREIAADLKQLPPFEKKKGIGSWVESLRPAIGIFGKGLETVGVTGPGKIISTIAETKLNTASPVDFPWWIKTISVEENPAVEWHISKSYLQSVGNRFVGTLVGYFLDCDPGNNIETKNALKMEIRVFLKPVSGNTAPLFISHMEENSRLMQENPELAKKGLSNKLFSFEESDESMLKIEFI